MLFDEPDPEKGEIFQKAELLPGDELWFENPYFQRSVARLQPEGRRWTGRPPRLLHRRREGHGHVQPRAAVRGGLSKDFPSMEERDNRGRAEQCEPKAADFQIKAVRRVIVDKA